MRTITLKEPGKLVLEDTQQPVPAAGEALVRVHRVGICGTDIHAFSGRQPYFAYPRILGHELGVEVVQAVANDSGIVVGDRCSVEPYINCQQCVACRRGKPNCCANLRVIGVHLDGGMRDTFAVPIRKLHRANRLSYDQIALVETLAIGAHAVQRANVEPDETVLVIGAGPIGLSVIQFAASRARVLVMDVLESRLAFCRERLGIREVISAQEDAVETVRRLTGGDMPTVVIDATGNVNSMNSSLALLAHGGRLVFVGLFKGDFALSDPEFHKRETTLLGSRNAVPRDFSTIIQLIEDRKIDTGAWITHRAAAEDWPKAFPDWIAGGNGLLKGIIHFD